MKPFTLFRYRRFTTRRKWKPTLMLQRPPLLVQTRLHAGATKTVSSWLSCDGSNVTFSNGSTTQSAATATRLLLLLEWQHLFPMSRLAVHPESSCTNAHMLSAALTSASLDTAMLLCFSKNAEDVSVSGQTASVCFAERSVAGSDGFGIVKTMFGSKSTVCTEGDGFMLTFAKAHGISPCSTLLVRQCSVPTSLFLHLTHLRLEEETRILYRLFVRRCHGRHPQICSQFCKARTTEGKMSRGCPSSHHERDQDNATTEPGQEREIQIRR